MNRWGIPARLEDEIKVRDTTCIYCGVEMIEGMAPRGSRRTVATWEHIVNDASIVTRENIARCCAACNASKGDRNLTDWLHSEYCKSHGINEDTVARVVKQSLARARRTATQPEPGAYADKPCRSG